MAGVPAAVKTTVTELGDSRVRLQVQVPPGEVEGRLERKAQQLGRELKLPGFRRGKVPAPLVIQRIGREVVLEEAVRDTLSSWYSDAIETAGIVPVGDPQLDLGELPAAGAGARVLDRDRRAAEGRARRLQGPRGRTARAGGRRRADRAGDRRDARAPRAAGDRRAARRRRATSSWSTTSARWSARAPTASRPCEPFAGGEGRDQLVELGAGNLIPGFEEGLLGASAGETRTVALTFPADYGSQELAGREASFEIDRQGGQAQGAARRRRRLRDRRRFRRPGRAARGHPQAAARGSRRRASRPSSVRRRSTRRWPRRRSTVTPELVKARAREMWERMLHSLSHRGISREAYLQIAGREEADVLAEMEPEAELALRREAVITARRRRRGHRARPRRSCCRRSRRPPSARESSRRSCSSELRARRAPGGGARGSRGARRRST